MTYFDSHSHYYDERFDTECGGNAEGLLDELFSTVLAGAVNVSTSPQNYGKAVKQARRFAHMYTALGIHPTDSQGLTEPTEQLMKELETALRDPENKAVAVGEIGLDYHYEDTVKQKQLEFFEEQLRLSLKLGLPVIIHDRDAHGDCFDMVMSYTGLRGVFHSFSGSAEMAKELVRHGFLISFSGTVTFKNARKVKEAAAALRPEDVLIETDCPYLAPEPHRGKCNHSGYLSYTNAALASCLGIDAGMCAEITAENAKRLFCLK